MPSSLDRTATAAVSRAALRHGDAELVRTARSAAVGLHRRGTRLGDVAALLLPPGPSYVLGLVSLLTAGVAVAPLDPEGDPHAAADLLTEHDARLLVTAPSLARTAMEVTEESRVRQIVSFGDLPGATPYADLTDAGGPPEIDAGVAALIGPGLVLTQGELAGLLDPAATVVGRYADGPVGQAVHVLRGLVGGTTLDLSVAGTVSRSRRSG
ncbi:MAG: AMP-binding protein [Streptosporangiales bacterium]|nr:AMP-binding protein [Streptosporangiales bacterium]